MKQIRRNIGSFLKKLRLQNNFSLHEISSYLAAYNVKCSYANLSRIENGNSAIRSDVIAGLSLIYDISTEEILFRGK
jgi:transcriptional regulator with XRE-family HTH domain